MTYSSLASQIRASLSPKFGAREASALTRIIFERIKGFSPVDMAINGDREVSSYIASKVDEVVGRLLNDEPVQYIFGIADFYGLEFAVNPSVLIPRPETAELVDMIVKRHSADPDMRVLDLCTGSGCIACSLARALPFSLVTATDNSPEALGIAKENAARLKVKVDFIADDILFTRLDRQRMFDIIVSNPPYVLESEKKEMEHNVLLHEPHQALFVPDADPLRFYKSIVGLAARQLSEVGSLFLEINPLEAESLRNLIEEEGFSDIDVIRDSQKRNRFIIASRR